MWVLYPLVPPLEIFDEWPVSPDVLFVHPKDADRPLLDPVRALDNVPSVMDYERFFLRFGSRFWTRTATVIKANTMASPRMFQD